jgi:hypothetical protein
MAMKRRHTSSSATARTVSACSLRYWVHSAALAVSMQSINSAVSGSSAQTSRTARSKPPRPTLVSLTPKLFSESRMLFSRSRNLRFRLRRWINSRRRR